MTNILLISEDTLKTHSCLNKNVWADNLAPVIKTSQDVDLQRILGSCLYKKILGLVENGDIKKQEYTSYKTLLDEYIINYLIYQTLVNLIPEISTKITNMGLVTTSDEHIQNVTQSERELVVGQYQKYADAYAKMLQDFLKENIKLFPELDCCGEAELNSSATVGLWLGGIRTKR
jgi:hypothetical protein